VKEHFFSQLSSQLDNELLKVLKMKVAETTQVECLRMIRGELEVGNADVKAIIEKEQMLAKKKQLKII
jgi:hypothetical protein